MSPKCHTMCTILWIWAPTDVLYDSLWNVVASWYGMNKRYPLEICVSTFWLIFERTEILSVVAIRCPKMSVVVTEWVMIKDTARPELAYPGITVTNGARYKKFIASDKNKILYYFATVLSEYGVLTFICFVLYCKLWYNYVHVRILLFRYL